MYAFNLLNKVIIIQKDSSDIEDHNSDDFVKVVEEDDDGEDDEDQEDDEQNRTWVGDNDRYDAFMYWLSENECSDEDKKEITNSFDLLCGCFTPNKLLRSVRWSDLFSSKDIDDSILEIMRFARREKIASEEDVEREFCYLGIL